MCAWPPSSGYGQCQYILVSYVSVLAASTVLINTSPQSVIAFIDYTYACKLQCGIDWDYFVIPACCDNCELKIIKQQNIAMYGVTENFQATKL